MNKRDKIIITLLLVIALVLLLSNLAEVFEPFKSFNSIMLPVYIGFILAFLLNPIVKLFERKVFFKIKSHSLNRGISILCSFILIAGVLTGFGFIIIPQIASSIKDLVANAPKYVDSLINSINNILNNLNINLVSGNLTKEAVINKVVGFISEIPKYFDKITVVFSMTLGIVTDILVGLFVSIYVLFSKERISAGARRITKAIFPKEVSDKILYYTKTANSKFSGYVMGNILDCCMIGLVGLIIFSIFDIPYAALISLIIGCTNFIPFFGPFIGGIPSAFIILIADPSKVIPFIIMIIVMQQIDGNFIQPKIIGDRTGLTSLGVISAITLMGGLFGFVGLVIGAPLTAMLVVIIEDFIRNKLKKKNLPTSLKDYYDSDDFMQLEDLEKEHAINKLWRIIKKKCPIKIVKKESESVNIEELSDEEKENNDTD